MPNLQRSGVGIGVQIRRGYQNSEEYGYYCQAKLSNSKKLTPVYAVSQHAAPRADQQYW